MRYIRPVTAVFFAAVILFCLVSCFRSGEEKAGDSHLADGVMTVESPAGLAAAAALIAVLHAGEHPLWFQVTPDGPVHIETVEDAVLSAALIPWPYAPHIRFFIAQNEDLLIAVNHSGFIRMSPRTGIAGGHAGTGLYYFSGGDFWRQYTVSGFFLLDEKPVALLFRDDRFLDTDMPPPSPRIWSETAAVPAAAVPAEAGTAFDTFAPDEGWNIDTLRYSGGFWYFRAVNKKSSQIRMLRTNNLSHEGEQIPLGTFQNAARPEPFSAAPAPLREMLTAVFAESGSFGTAGTVTIISPELEFPGARSFSNNRESRQMFSGFYTTSFIIIIDPKGAGLYVQTDTGTTSPPSVKRFSLPPLPEGFVYTGIGLSDDTVFASWEEQEGYSIGAAGFMVILLSALR